jgi:hypothetical protein
LQASRSTNAAALSRLIGTEYSDIKCGLKTASRFAGGREVKKRRVETCIRRYEQPESFKLKQLGVVAERSEVAVFVLRHHTRMIANQDGSVYSTRCSAANAVYREDQWQRRSKHTELES